MMRRRTGVARAGGSFRLRGFVVVVTVTDVRVLFSFAHGGGYRYRILCMLELIVSHSDDDVEVA
jgi:hypothetical protein